MGRVGPGPELKGQFSQKYDIGMFGILESTLTKIKSADDAFKHFHAVSIPPTTENQFF